MSLRIYPHWDFATLGTAPSFSMSVTDNDGADTVSISTGTYAHVTMASVVSTITAFSAALKTAMDAAKTTVTYTVSFSESTQGYTITPSAGTTAITFTGPAGTLAKRMLGFTGDVLATASAVSDAKVCYAMDCSIGAKSNPTGDYEPEDVAEVGEADDGSSYMIGRTTAPVYSDFIVPFEPLAKTMTLSAAAADPWTWQHFFAHCRLANSYILVKDSGAQDNSVHRLRQDGVAFRPTVSGADPNYTAYYDIQLRTFLVGRV